MKIEIIVVVYLLAINIIAFAMYGIDKSKAKKHEWRTPESALVSVAAVGGSIGALAGMHVFHHKTKKPKFYVGIPVILIVQAIIAVLVARAVL